MNLKVIARIKSDFKEKFGIPRQSGILNGLESVIVFEKPFRNPDTLKGLETFSHIWLIWEFDRNSNRVFKATVRPPRLGGNKRIGVFATRSPFRPNNLGLSCVRLLRIEKTENDGVVLVVAGADLADGTPIYDIKPYLPFTDSIPNADYGFAEETENFKREVVIEKELLDKIPASKRDSLIKILENDPKPSYQTDEKRVYGLVFAGYEIKFNYKNEKLHVIEVEEN